MLDFQAQKPSKNNYGGGVDHQVISSVISFGQGHSLCPEEINSRRDIIEDIACAMPLLLMVEFSPVISSKALTQSTFGLLRRHEANAARNGHITRDNLAYPVRLFFNLNNWASRNGI